MDYSIIIPVHNAEDTILACLKSLQGQKVSQPDYEIIVVDDGSKDQTARLVARHYPDVQLWQQKQQGPAKARNVGAHQAQGDIILFIDADCEATPNWLQEMVKPFQAPEVVGVKGAYQTKQKEWVAQIVQMEYEMKYSRMQKLARIDFVDTYSAAFRKNVFLQSGGYSEHFIEASVEDQEFSFRLSRQSYTMVFNPQAIVYHRHAYTPGQYFRKKFKIGYWKVLVLKQHPQKIVYDSHTPQTLKIQILLIYLSGVLVILAWLLPGPAWWWAGLIGLGAYGILAFWEMRRLFRRRISLGLFSIVILFLRNVALGSGLIWGILTKLAQSRQ